jgi:MFS family permease
MPKLRSNITFLRLFFGRLITNAGDSLYYIGAMWLVFDLTGSPFYTGVAGAIVKLSSTVQFLYGPLVDRWDLRKILVGTQSIQAIVILAIPLAAVTGHLSVWLVLSIMPLLAFVNEIVYPAQNAVLPQIVEEDQLVRANSLFSTAYKGTEIAFNAAAGVLLTLVSITTVFIIDSITFAVAAALFLGVIIPTADEDDSEDEDDEAYFTKLRNGFDYLWGSVMLKMIIVAMIPNIGAGALLAVLPAFADSIGGPGMYGLLMAAIAGGTFLGAAMASLFEDLPYGLVSAAGFLVSGLSLYATVTVSGRLAIVALFFTAHISSGTFNVIFMSLIQSSVEEAYLGRVFSVISSVAMAMVPLGNVVGGAVAAVYSPALVFYAAALMMLLSGVYYLVHPQIRSLPSPADADAATLGLGLSS